MTDEIGWVWLLVADASYTAVGIGCVIVGGLAAMQLARVWSDVSRRKSLITAVMLVHLAVGARLLWFEMYKVLGFPGWMVDHWLVIAAVLVIGMEVAIFCYVYALRRWHLIVIAALMFAGTGMMQLLRG